MTERELKDLIVTQVAEIQKLKEEIQKLEEKFEATEGLRTFAWDQYVKAQAKVAELEEKLAPKCVSAEKAQEPTSASADDMGLTD